MPALATRLEGSSASKDIWSDVEPRSQLMHRFHHASSKFLVDNIERESLGGKKTLVGLLSLFVQWISMVHQVVKLALSPRELHQGSVASWPIGEWHIATCSPFHMQQFQP